MPDGTVNHFQPLVDFCYSESASSLTTLLKPVRAFGFLYDYCVQMEKHYELLYGGKTADNRRLVIMNFANHLRFGTIERDGTDSTGLFWPPGQSVNVLKGWGFWLDKVFDWLVDIDAGDEFARTMSLFEGINLHSFGFAAESRKLRKFSFLAHLVPRRRSGTPRKALGEGIFKPKPFGSMKEEDVIVVPQVPIYAFPTDLLVPLVTNGFITNPGARDIFNRVDWTGQMFAALSVGGGRGSESYHMWTNDLQLVDDKVLGFLRHPERFVERGLGSREWVLWDRYGLRPRTQLEPRFHAGFKSPRLNEHHWSAIRWLPLPGFQPYFAALVRYYLAVIRPRAMAFRRSQGLSDHPYLLVSLRHCPKQSVFIGDPYTVAAGRSSWKRAVQRLSKTIAPELTYAKEQGTTRHGVRHRFGLTLDDLGLPVQEIQRDMHHKSLWSTLVYCQRTDEESHARLEESAIKKAEIMKAFVNRSSFVLGS